MKRIDYVDFAKGIGIVLVVLGHCVSTNTSIGRWIFSFHMPLFFFLSGFCLDNSKYTNFKSLFLKRIQQLIIPYVSFVVILVSLQALFFGDGTFITALYVQFKRFISDGGIGATWFLPVLFFSELVYFLCLKLVACSKLFLFILLVSLSIVGNILHSLELDLPFSLSAVLPAVLFYGFGNILNGTIQEAMRKFGNKRMLLLIPILGLLTVVLSIVINPAINMCLNRMTPYFLGYLGAFTGICLIFLMSNFLARFSKKSFFLDQSKIVIKYLGLNTLSILAFHMFFIGLSSGFVKPMIGSYFMYKIVEQIVVWFLIYLSIQTINKYFPWLIGKKKLKFDNTLTLS